MGEFKPPLIQKPEATLQKNKYTHELRNPFYNKAKKGWKQPEKLTFTFPHVEEFTKKEKRPFSPDELLTIQYPDKNGKVIKRQITTTEYLKCIGFCNKSKEDKFIPKLDYFNNRAQSYEELQEAMHKTQAECIEKRMKGAFLFESALEGRANPTDDELKEYNIDPQELIMDKISRERQLRSQQEEDPFFELLFKNFKGINVVKIPPQCDYLDKIDVMIEIDPTEAGVENSENIEPILIGFQRTLRKPTDPKLLNKEKEIEKQPLWYVPEYAHKNPVLRVLYRENDSEYYLDDQKNMYDERTSRFGILKALATRESEIKPEIEDVLISNSYDQISNNFQKTKELKLRLKKLDRQKFPTQASAIEKELAEKARPAKLMLAKKVFDILSQTLNKIREYANNAKDGSVNKLRHDEKILEAFIEKFKKDNDIIVREKTGKRKMVS